MPVTAIGSTTSILRRDYTPPRERIRVHTNDPLVFALADRLWRRDPELSGPPGPPIHLHIIITPDSTPRPLADVRERWDVTDSSASATLPGGAQTCIRFAAQDFYATAARWLVTGHPPVAARLLLEAPAAELMARRAHTVVHAGAIVGPGQRAVVVRGPSGTGKSTLIAAAWCAGMEVLGDESVLVSRENPNLLASSVRDICLRQDVIDLVGVPGNLAPATDAREAKWRVDLFTDSAPSNRWAHRIATVLLGDRDATPARLVRLEPERFCQIFAEGEIPQERWAGDPTALAQRWASQGTYQLRGTVDLTGAVGLLKSLLTKGERARGVRA